MPAPAASVTLLCLAASAQPAPGLRPGVDALGLLMLEVADQNVLAPALGGEPPRRRQSAGAAQRQEAEPASPEMPDVRTSPARAGPQAAFAPDLRGEPHRERWLEGAAWRQEATLAPPVLHAATSLVGDVSRKHVCEEDDLGQQIGCRHTCECPRWQQCYTKRRFGKPLDIGICELSMQLMALMSMAVSGFVYLLMGSARRVLMQLDFKQEQMKMRAGREASEQQMLQRSRGGHR